MCVCTAAFTFDMCVCVCVSVCVELDCESEKSLHLKILLPFLEEGQLLQTEIKFPNIWSLSKIGFILMLNMPSKNVSIQNFKVFSLFCMEC